MHTNTPAYHLIVQISFIGITNSTHCTYDTYVSTDLFWALSFDPVLTWRACRLLFRGNVLRSPITNASFMFFVDTNSHITNYAIIHNKPAVVVFILNV